MFKKLSTRYISLQLSLVLVNRAVEETYCCALTYAKIFMGCSQETREKKKKLQCFVYWKA